MQDVIVLLMALGIGSLLAALVGPFCFNALRRPVAVVKKSNEKILEEFWGE